MTNIGKIANIFNKYVILGDKSFILEKDNPILGSLLTNDVVEYTYIYDKNDNNNSKNIKILKLIERNEQYLVGIIVDVKKLLIYLPGYPTINRFNIFKNIDNVSIKEEDIVLIKSDMNGMFIKKSYGDIKNRMLDKNICLDLYNYNVNQDIDLDIDVDVDNIKNRYTKEFQDLTHLYTFTVDPDQSKDYDDAISLEIYENDKKLYVHIVDINHLVQFGSDIDQNSLKYGYTIYLPEHIQNIIPQEMAENTFSILEGEYRYVITVEYNIDNDYNIKSYDIYPSLINSKKRYTYGTFENDINLDKFIFLCDFCKKWSSNTLNIPHLQITKDNIDDSGNLVGDFVLYNDHIKSHKIIETVMVLTNLTISKHLSSYLKNIPQRFHSSSKYKSIESLTGIEEVDSILTIKKYKSATYEIDEEKKGHFGLGLDQYCHFTSPIRRYFDVIIHRILAGYNFSETSLKNTLEYINYRERKVEDIYKFYKELKILSYLDFHKNKNCEYECYVISTNKNGILILIRELLYEIFKFTKNKYNIGEKVMIKISSINWKNLDVIVDII